MNTINIQVPSIGENIRMIESFIDNAKEKFHLDDDMYGNIMIAVTEAVNNAIKHGNREDRKKVMAEFFGSLGKFRGTFGSTLSGQVQSDIFFARARKYNTALEASLDGPNVPTSVYTRLIDGVNRHLPTFHRYLKLRQRMMKLQDLHYYDLYAPLVSSVDLSYTVDEAQTIVLRALEPRSGMRTFSRGSIVVDRASPKRSTRRPGVIAIVR